MQAHRLRITIPENHQLTIQLPVDIPPGQAEIIVLSEPPVRGQIVPSFEERLDAWIRGLPAAPVVSLEALRRESLYE